MSLINNTVALEKGLRAEFIRGVSQAPMRLIPRLATIVESKSDSESYAWFGEAPQMEELKDQRKYRGLSDGKYTIVNKEWANGIQVKRKEILNDQLGVIMMRVRQLAERARKFPLKLVFDLMNNAEDTVKGLGYDGVSYFNDAHPARGQQTATQDNKLAGTGVTVAALKTDVGTSVAQMQGFLDEAGEPFHEIIDPADLIIVCGPTLAPAMREAISAGIISNTTNTLVGQIGELVVNPRYTDTNDWDLYYVGDYIKPFILQEREALQFEAQEDGSDDAFDKKVYKYGAYMQANAGYGPWQLGVRTKN